MPKASTIAAYAGMFVFVVSCIAIGYQPQQAKGEAAQIVATPAVLSDAHSKTSVDQATATQIATTMAQATNLPIAANVANMSISVNAKNQLAQTDDTLISKPQIVQPTANNRTVLSYTTKDGDTVQSLADKYQISAQTIKWANGLTSDTLEADKPLDIPPVDGVIYTVKASDTADSIAEKYSVDAKRVVTFNDLELTGVKEGAKLILPGGILPTEERPGYAAPKVVSIGLAGGTTGSSGLVGGYTPINTSLASASAGNAYAFGNCTWWAYERRAQLGHPVGSFWGNAATWDTFGRAAGYVVDKNPTAGSVFQMPAFVDAYTGVYGHVGIVESVNGDGSVNVSEMNYAGNFNRVTNRTIPAAQAALYNYIH